MYLTPVHQVLTTLAESSSTILVLWDGQVLPLLPGHVHQLWHQAPVGRSEQGQDGREVDIAKEDVEREEDDDQ